MADDSPSTHSIHPDQISYPFMDATRQFRITDNDDANEHALRMIELFIWPNERSQWKCSKGSASACKKGSSISSKIHINCYGPSRCLILSAGYAVRLSARHLIFISQSNGEFQIEWSLISIALFIACFYVSVSVCVLSDLYLPLRWVLYRSQSLCHFLPATFILWTWRKYTYIACMHRVHQGHDEKTMKPILQGHLTQSELHFMVNECFPFKQRTSAHFIYRFNLRKSGAQHQEYDATFTFLFDRPVFWCWR